ncbi:MAG TPA: YhdP family protein [Burkholderiaceae bacterium]|nr:YhdP family protein [Burkholderiaceae bacterium]
MNPPTDRPATLARELGARASQIEQALERAVGEKLEHRLQAAEASVARRFGARALHGLRWTMRALIVAVVGGFFAFGLLLLALRYWILPDIDAMRPRIESIASAVLRAPVTIGRIEARWQGVNPALALTDVRIMGRHGAALMLPQIRGTLSWSSLPALQPRFARLRVEAPELEIVLLEGGAISVAGIVIDPNEGGGDNQLLDWVLAQGEVVVMDARVQLRDERVTPARELLFSDADLLLEGGLTGNRFGLHLAPPSDVAGPVDLRGEFHTGPFARRSDFRLWTGQLFAQVDYIDLASVNQWVQAPFNVGRASGALRAWARFDAFEIVGTTADLALKDVDARLAPDLQPLRMSSFQGRVTQSRWGDEERGGQQLGLVGVTFVLADGARFPPLDLSYRYTRASGDRSQQFEVEGSRIDLASLAGIVTHVPLGASLRQTIARYAPRGQLSEVAMRWEGAEPEWNTLTAKARFDQLSLAAQPAADGPGVGTPGFERLSGSVQLDRGAAALHLASRDVVVELPGVFQEPRLAFSQLRADVKWKPGERAEARIDSLSLESPDIAISASGTWRPSASGKGSGSIDISGRIPRLAAKSAHRYVPLVAGAGTVAWLQSAILDGRVEDGAFRLRGDLARFPFPAAADGEFRVTARLRGGVLDVAPQAAADGQLAPGAVWPLLRDIDADLLFERQGMTITAQRGTMSGARITEAVARVPDLGHDATLEVKGQLAGELADLIGGINASPVARWIGEVTRGAEARGSARTDLQLTVPLLHAGDARVKGSLQFQNNDLTLADVAPFTRVSGVMNFSERGVRFSNVAAGFLGGQVRLDATTRGDGALVLSTAGSATAAGLKRAFDIDVVQRLLERSQGTTRYTSTLTVHSGGLQLVVDSDLTGFAIDGVAPIRKTAAEALQFRLERSSRDGNENLRISAGRLFGLIFEHRRDRGVARLVHGVVAINETPNLPESGLLVQVNAPRFDVEAWAQWLGLDLAGGAATSARPASSDDALRVDYFALRTPELVIERRVFRNVTLGASRADGGGFDVNVVSDGVIGYIGWRPGALGTTGGASMGHVTARLSKLVIPSSKKDDIVGALQAPTRQLPAFEVTAENFELGPTKYGRLELVASNAGAGAAANWKLSRLEITNPDMKASASGEWSGMGSARRMRIAFTLDTSDVGATLGRFGTPGAVARGHGKLDGRLDWAGSPFDIDYASLGGTLALRIEDGRFLKVDSRGAGRLLTLLSLQSLSRTLLADTRETFGEGFSFSVIKADAAINRGVMSTENFSMTGTGAAALISGSVDLRNETQQLHLVVLPEIDASTAALALGVANPILGLGALLANTVLRAPLSRAFALDYDITGTWNDPIVTRRARIAANPSENPR